MDLVRFDNIFHNRIRHRKRLRRYSPYRISFQSRYCIYRNQPHGAKSVIWTTLAQLYTRAELEYLPVYYPNTEEQKDPKLYASNVRELMASNLMIPTSEMTFEEVKSRYAKLYKNKKLIKSKDKDE